MDTSAPTFRTSSARDAPLPPGWVPSDPRFWDPAGGVALSCKNGALPESFVRMRESDIDLAGTSAVPQLDLVIQCWKAPKQWAQMSTPPAPQPPPDFSIRFTGSFQKGLKAIDVLHLMQQLIASDPHNFSTGINYDNSLVLIALANHLIKVSGTIVGWTKYADPNTTLTGFDLWGNSV